MVVHLGNEQEVVLHIRSALGALIYGIPEPALALDKFDSANLTQWMYIFRDEVLVTSGKLPLASKIELSCCIGSSGMSWNVGSTPLDAIPVWPTGDNTFSAADGASCSRLVASA